jgi:uridine phosphorylase
MGGPSAALVLADLAKLGVERVVRVGTCAAFGAAVRPGELLLSSAALAIGGSAASFGVAAGKTVPSDPVLLARLHAELGDEAREVTIASLDTLPADAAAAGGALAADMQTLALLARARALEIAAAAVLIVAELEGGEALGDEALERAATQAGRAAAKALSNPQVEG